ISFPGIFKYFIIIFLSRGLSVCESKMVEMYVDFHHNDGKIYFWFDDERKRNSKYNHVSFKLDSFKYLEKVMKEEEKHIEEGEIDREDFKIKCLKENWHIFLV
ncbi:787_t:CDS:1, partial [Dentiscutata heterogama]